MLCSLGSKTKQNNKNKSEKDGKKNKQVCVGGGKKYGSHNNYLMERERVYKKEKK